jgi:hypothetical protein
MKQTWNVRSGILDYIAGFGAHGQFPSLSSRKRSHGQYEQYMPAEVDVA